MRISILSVLVCIAAGSSGDCLADNFPPVTVQGRVTVERQPSFSKQLWSIPEDALPAALVLVLDANGDGCKDLLAEANTTLKLLLSDCQQGFRNGGWTGMPAPAPVLESADFNGDGSSDLLRCDGPAGCTVAFSNGSFGFLPAVKLAAPVLSEDHGVVTGDFDGDGCGDLIFGRFEEQVWTVIRGQPDGTLSAPRSAGVFPERPAFFSGDHDGNGAFELFYEHVSEKVQHWQYLPFDPEPGGVAPYGDFSRSAIWKPARAGDINGDGRTDLLTFGSNLMGWWALLGRGEGPLQMPVSLPAPDDDALSMLADVNGDGLDDLLRSRSASGKLELYLAIPGRGVAEAIVEIDGQARTQTDQEGRFSVSGLDPGVHHVSIHKGGQSFSPQRRVLPPGCAVHRALSFIGSDPVQAELETGQVNSLIAPVHGPFVCNGLERTASGEIGRTYSRCGPGSAVFEVNDPGSAPRMARAVQIIGTCCRLPADDILLENRYSAFEECPDGWIATGATPHANCDDCYNYLECTKINSDRYQLGDPAPGEYWGTRLDRRNLKRSWSRDELPPAVRFGFGRFDISRWDDDGCVGSPLGSVLTRKGAKRCVNFRFRQLQYTGAVPGDPPRGTPVEIFPHCARYENPFDLAAGCQRDQ